MSSKLQQATAQAGPRMAGAMADADAAKIGAAAERKRQEENAAQLDAILTSEASGGRAVYWRRRITVATDDETESGRTVREVLHAERAGSYSPRAFLRLAERAAAQAGRGRWSRQEAVEAVAAELVVRVMSKTGGRMPTRGSLGRHATGHENPDLAYLTVTARRLIVSAQRGDADAAGLAAEAAPVTDAAQQEAAEGLTVAELMAESEAAAEGPADRYLTEAPDPSADLLTRDARWAAEQLAAAAPRRPAAALAATVAALRGNLAKSSDLATSGYATSAGAARKAASVGRQALREGFTLSPGGPSKWRARDWAMLSALANLCEEENSHRQPPHISEQVSSSTYRMPKREWPSVTQPEKIAPIVTYTANAPEWRTDR